MSWSPSMRTSGSTMGTKPHACNSFDVSYAQSMYMCVHICTYLYIYAKVQAECGAGLYKTRHLAHSCVFSQLACVDVYGSLRGAPGTHSECCAPLGKPSTFSVLRHLYIYVVAPYIYVVAPLYIYVVARAVYMHAGTCVIQRGHRMSSQSTCSQPCNHTCDSRCKLHAAHPSPVSTSHLPILAVEPAPVQQHAGLWRCSSNAH